MTDYYCHLGAGNNGNSGLDWANAWATLQASSPKLSAGDTLYVRKADGDVWFKDWFPSSAAGIAGNPIRIVGELPNDPPKITGSNVYANGSGLTDNLDGRWYVNTSQGAGDEGIGVLEDDVPLARATSAALTDGGWFHDGSQFWYKPTSGDPANHVVRKKHNEGGFTITHDYVEVENFSIWFGNGYACTVRASNCVVRNFHANQTQWGLHALGSSRGGNVCDNLLIEDSTATRCRLGIYTQFGHTNLTLRNCQSIENGRESEEWFTQDRSGIAIGGDGTSAADTCYDTLIEDCIVRGNGGTASDPGFIAWYAERTTITRCTVEDNFYGGLMVGVYSNDSIVQDCTVRNNGIAAKQSASPNDRGIRGGIAINKSAGVQLLRNTVVSNYVSRGVRTDDGSDIEPKGGLDIRDTDGFVTSGPTRVIDNQFYKTEDNHSGQLGTYNYWKSPTSSQLEIEFDPPIYLQALEPDVTQYTLAIREDGTQLMSDPDAEVEPPPGLNPVTSFKTTAVTQNSITVSWTVDAGQTVTGFDLQAGEDGISYPTVIDITNSTTRSHVFNGLNSNTTYYFRIAVVNGADKSSYVTTSGTTTVIVQPPGDYVLMDLGKSCNEVAKRNSQPIDKSFVYKFDQSIFGTENCGTTTVRKDQPDEKTFATDHKVQETESQMEWAIWENDIPGADYGRSFLFDAFMQWGMDSRPFEQYDRLYLTIRYKDDAFPYPNAGSTVPVWSAQFSKPLGSLGPLKCDHRWHIKQIEITDKSLLKMEPTGHYFFSISAINDRHIAGYITVSHIKLSPTNETFDIPPEKPGYWPAIDPANERFSNIGRDRDFGRGIGQFFPFGGYDPLWYNLDQSRISGPTNLGPSPDPDDQWLVYEDSGVNVALHHEFAIANMSWWKAADPSKWVKPTIANIEAGVHERIAGLASHGIKYSYNPLTYTTAGQIKTRHNTTEESIYEGKMREFLDAYKEDSSILCHKWMDEPDHGGQSWSKPAQYHRAVIKQSRDIDPNCPILTTTMGWHGPITGRYWGSSDPNNIQADIVGNDTYFVDWFKINAGNDYVNTKFLGGAASGPSDGNNPPTAHTFGANTVSSRPIDKTASGNEQYAWQFNPTRASGQSYLSYDVKANNPNFSNDFEAAGGGKYYEFDFQFETGPNDGDMVVVWVTNLVGATVSTMAMSLPPNTKQWRKFQLTIEDANWDCTINFGVGYAGDSTDTVTINPNGVLRLVYRALGAISHWGGLKQCSRMSELYDECGDNKLLAAVPVFSSVKHTANLKKPIYDEGRVPNQAEMLWQTWYNLSMNAQGFFYFMMLSPVLGDLAESADPEVREKNRGFKGMRDCWAGFKESARRIFNATDGIIDCLMPPWTIKDMSRVGRTGYGATERFPVSSRNGIVTVTTNYDNLPADERPDFVWIIKENAGVEVMLVACMDPCWENGINYPFDKTPRPVTATFTVTGMSDGAKEVRFEARNVTASGGSFSDTFNYLETRTYIIEGSLGAPTSLQASTTL